MLTLLACDSGLNYLWSIIESDFKIMIIITFVLILTRIEDQPYL
jgi:hypothetical protein